MSTQGQVSPEELQQFYDTTERSSLVPGWVGSARRLPPSPTPSLWRWSEVEPLFHRSGEVGRRPQPGGTDPVRHGPMLSSPGPAPQPL